MHVCICLNAFRRPGEKHGGPDVQDSKKRENSMIKTKEHHVDDQQTVQI